MISGKDLGEWGPNCFAEVSFLVSSGIFSKGAMESMGLAGEEEGLKPFKQPALFPSINKETPSSMSIEKAYLLE